MRRARRLRASTSSSCIATTATAMPRVSRRLRASAAWLLRDMQRLRARSTRWKAKPPRHVMEVAAIHAEPTSSLGPVAACLLERARDRVALDLFERVAERQRTACDALHDRVGGGG